MAAGLASDYLQFRKDEYITKLQEAVEEFAELPLRLHFQEIVDVLREKTITPFTPIAIKKWLYDLKFALESCVQLAEKERERKLQNKKTHLDLYSAKKLLFLRKTAKKLLRIKDKLQGLTDLSATEISLLSDSIRSACSGWDVSPFNASQIHGFDDQLRKIKSLLHKTLDSGGGVKAIGIVGMGGVGKSTLAQMLVNVSKDLFSPIIWVSLSPNVSCPQIVRRMLQQLLPIHLRVNTTDLARLLRILHSKLCGNRYLIVLDNVWQQNEWYSDLGSNPQRDCTVCFNRLSHGLPVGGGGAVVVTSRFKEVARSMVGEQSLLRIEPFFDENAIWSIFTDSIERKTFLTWDHHQVLSRMKEEIIYNCHGLPLAAKTLAEGISIQLAKNESWSDSTINKEFCLKIRGDYATYWKITKKLMTLPGVSHANDGAGMDEITVGGRCNPAEIVRELGRFWQTELISVSIDPKNESYEDAKRKSNLRPAAPGDGSFLFRARRVRFRAFGGFDIRIWGFSGFGFR